jgi:mono/diheme cytochrome c family protein
MAIVGDAQEVSMKRFVALLAVTSFVLPLAARASAEDAALVAKGRKVYEATTPKCQACHSIGGVGNAKGPLDGVGAKLKAEEIKAWHRTPKEMTEKSKATRKPLMPAYPKEKLSDADLEALTAYLMSLKK